jgi:hypothetical protein
MVFVTIHKVHLVFQNRLPIIFLHNVEKNPAKSLVFSYICVKENYDLYTEISVT